MMIWARSSMYPDVDVFKKERGGDGVRFGFVEGKSVVFTRGKLRKKNVRCTSCDTPIAPGDPAWYGITNGHWRACRWCARCFGE